MQEFKVFTACIPMGEGGVWERIPAKQMNGAEACTQFLAIKNDANVGFI